MYMCVCRDARVGSQNLTIGFFYYCLPYLLGQGPFTEPGHHQFHLASLAGQAGSSCLWVSPDKIDVYHYAQV